VSASASSLSGDGSNECSCGTLKASVTYDWSAGALNSRRRMPFCAGSSRGLRGGTARAGMLP
jgi:hypothetical protein